MENENDENHVALEIRNNLNDGAPEIAHNQNGGGRPPAHEEARNFFDMPIEATENLIREHPKVLRRFAISIGVSVAVGYCPVPDDSVGRGFAIAGWATLGILVSSVVAHIFEKGYEKAKPALVRGIESLTNRINEFQDRIARNIDLPENADEAIAAYSTGSQVGGSSNVRSRDLRNRNPESPPNRVG